MKKWIQKCPQNAAAVFSHGKDVGRWFESFSLFYGALWRTATHCNTLQHAPMTAAFCGHFCIHWFIYSFIYAIICLRFRGCICVLIYWLRADAIPSRYLWAIFGYSKFYIWAKKNYGFLPMRIFNIFIDIMISSAVYIYHLYVYWIYS